MTYQRVTCSNPQCNETFDRAANSKRTLCTRCYSEHRRSAIRERSIKLGLYRPARQLSSQQMYRRMLNSFLKVNW